MVGGSSNYSSFVDALEFVHGAVLVAFGGAQLTADQGDMHCVSRSSNDAAFFVHYAFVDQLWAARQTSAGKSGTEYTGMDHGRPVRSTDLVAPFGATVRQTFELPCVSYAQSVPGPQGRSAAGEPRSRPDAEKLVEASSGDKLWPIELFARRNGM